MTRLLSLAASAFLLAVIVTSAEPAPAEQQCAVHVEFTLHSTIGPIVIQNACLSAPAVYANGTLTIEAVDFSPSIFHNGFDPQ